MERIDKEAVLVSDLTIHARQPKFEISPDNFEQLLSVVSQVGVEGKRVD